MKRIDAVAKKAKIIHNSTIKPQFFLKFMNNFYKLN